MFSQPLMTVLFGKLVNQFVNFTIITMELGSSEPSVAAQAQADLPIAAAAFRHQAGLLAIYLVIIGIFEFTKMQRPVLI
jgi:ATP-binding cassette subfamily B (MDR/TAP) protein 1